MLRYGRDMQVLAMGYAMLAGAVDAVGFLKSGGLFVSFMSGNSTRLAIGVAQTATIAAAAAGIIALFVAGVILNVLVSESAPAGRRKLVATIGVVVALVLAAIMDTLGQNLLAIGFLCLGMGAANAIFRREGEVSIGVTYMTGTLVKLGHRLADALQGDRHARWQPYLLLWLSLVIGGIAGALSYLWSPLASVWIVAAASLVLAVITWCLQSPGKPVSDV